MKLIAVLILIVLYILPIPFLLLRNGMQYICMGLDWAFDAVAWLVGWNTAYWPLQKAHDDPLPFTRSYYEGYEDCDAM